MYNGENHKLTPEENVVQFERDYGKTDRKDRISQTRPTVTASMNLRQLIILLEKEGLQDTVSYQNAMRLIGKKVS